ncbi:hypothetical protein C8035_v011223 [Colletotrichum spinosum]|uniref:Uncharacterized protein n=1 Tax=Colletotrichum spinosum TaxID=1347390 RepID=A0A4R8PWH9_9PEZI|nr:hypothetical protein C8035_v011223 [Colletotrichum spinosum]
MLFFSTILLTFAAIMSSVSAECLDSGPATSTFDAAKNDCIKGQGFDFKCVDHTGRNPFFLCCSKANCT